ncbi:unnamed protein product [Medioppia subpectinata]|uniref:Uncharacterized protein n=1 Tax=Medioppia subpectinata TaxID=1979941 RepID=A0A7R9L047_9ACAR|nr:unnamed protein product [Medioppia subpectinata]CAG2113157.1 unnamed protein product [Medioppia subpectinata]
MSSVCTTHSYTAITTPRTERWSRNRWNACFGALSTIKYSREGSRPGTGTTPGKTPYGTVLSIRFVILNALN